MEETKSATTGQATPPPQKVRKKLTPEERIKKLKERLAKAEANVANKNRKLRNHRLILIGAEVERKLKEDHQFDIVKRNLDDFKNAVVTWANSQKFNSI